MANSPTSVLADEIVEAPLITEEMAEVERLLEAKREEEACKKMTPVMAASPSLNNTMFNKLESLLSQTQLYSQFLREKMNNIALNGDGVPPVNGKKAGRGSKRKSIADNLRVAKKVKEGDEGSEILNEDDFLTEEERCQKEQEEIAPLLTGGILKDYQLKGVKWMISLWQNGLNGILADQMGLGKTIQTIGLLAHLKGKGMHGPFLIVAPLSTLSNWVNEIKRWVPSMSALLYHGSKFERGELRKNMPTSITAKFPVFVTSYEVSINDRKFLSRRKWKYIIVDEGHRLKNFDCKLIRELKQIPTENTLLLTGTPLQNNLAELWSLLNFILPEIFTSLSQFESWFDLSGRPSQAPKEEIDEMRRLEVVSKLHAILRPFLLRRLKEDVEKSLPLKKEILLYAPMTSAQREFQEHLVNKTLNDYFEQKISGAGNKSRLNNVIMQLRKNCNHPDLLASHFDENASYPPVKQLLEQCGKLQLLDRLLVHLKARGHKVLLFSQMTRMLDVLEFYLQEMGMDPCRIDGQVKLKDRQQQIHDFNHNKKKFIFLLSTRAGGLGINLTAADTVIIYDSDWNPHMDLQAMDRCHRIGQKDPVHVYRLVTSQSVECKMIKIANSKMKLEHVVIEKGHFKQEQHEAMSSVQEVDILNLLRDKRDEVEEYVQSASISDENLLKAIDREELRIGFVDTSALLASRLPSRGPGWEVVFHGSSHQNILDSLDNADS